MPLEIASAGQPRRLRLSGELDLSVAAQVALRLEVEAAGEGDLVLDLSSLRFIDSSGVRALIRATGRITPPGRLVLWSPMRHVGVVLSLMGLDRKGSRILVERGRDGDEGKAMARSFPARLSALSRIREFVRRRAVIDSFEPWVDEIVLAVSEAGANTVIHSGTTQVHVSWRPFGDRVEVEVRDSGTFKRTMPSAAPDQLSGRGFLLMMSGMDQISIDCGTDQRPGTVVRMVKRRSSELRSRSGSKRDAHRVASQAERVAS